jgi:hypothetical protein
MRVFLIAEHYRAAPPTYGTHPGRNVYLRTISAADAAYLCFLAGEILGSCCRSPVL